MEFEIADALILLSNTSNQQYIHFLFSSFACFFFFTLLPLNLFLIFVVCRSGPEDNSLEDESEVADAERDSENVKITQVDYDFLSMEFWVIVWQCWFHINFEIFVETRSVLVALFFAHILVEETYCSVFEESEFWVIVWQCWFHINFEIFVETRSVLVALFFAHILVEETYCSVFEEGNLLLCFLRNRTWLLCFLLIF